MLKLPRLIAFGCRVRPNNSNSQFSAPGRAEITSGAPIFLCTIRVRPECPSPASTENNRCPGSCCLCLFPCFSVFPQRKRKTKFLRRPGASPSARHPPIPDATNPNWTILMMATGKARRSAASAPELSRAAIAAISSAGICNPACTNIKTFPRINFPSSHKKKEVSRSPSCSPPANPRRMRSPHGTGITPRAAEITPRSIPNPGTPTERRNSPSCSRSNNFPRCCRTTTKNPAIPSPFITGTQKSQRQARHRLHHVFLDQHARLVPRSNPRL